MSSPSTELTRRMAIYEQFHQINRWGDTFNSDNSPNTGSSTIVQVDGRLENKVKLDSVLFLGWMLKLFLPVAGNN